MKKLKFYQLMTTGLFALNLAMIIFFITTRPNPIDPPGRGMHFQKRAINILDLNADQSNQFAALAKQHHLQMMDLQVSQKELLQPYFDMLKEEPKQDNDSLFIVIGDNEVKKIKATYAHFQEVKELLNDDQVENFDRFMDESLKILFHKKMPK